MGKKMDYLKNGIEMDKRNLKELIETVIEMDYDFSMKMDRRNMKGLTRMVN